LLVAITLALLLAASPAFAQGGGSAAGVAGQVITPYPGMTIRGPNTGGRDAIPDAGVSSAAPNPNIGTPNTGLSGGSTPGDSGTAGAIVGNTGGDTGLRSTSTGTTDIHGNGISAAPSSPASTPPGSSGTPPR
jgi:hypothetical protein